MFFDGPEGVELKMPWKPDIDLNIPHDIREVCEPMYVTIRYPSIDSSKPGVIEKRKILGVKIDFNTEPGREMWERVERYVEESTPRDERIPVPVVCSKDERSAFETFTPRRNATGSLEMISAPVPVVDLTRFIKEETPAIPPAAVVLEELSRAEDKQPQDFQCSECRKVFKSQHGLKIHLVRPKGHVKEKAGAA